MFLAAKRRAGTCIRTYNKWQHRGRPGGVPALIGAVIGTTPLPPPPRLDPEAIFRDANEAERQTFFEYVRQRNFAGYEARVALMRELNATAAVTASNGTPTGTATSTPAAFRLPEIPTDRGIMLVRPEGFAVVDEAIAEAKRDFAGYVPGTNKRDFDSLQGVPRSNRTHTSALNRLASHPEVLRVVSNYMGMLPVLHRINLLYSPNDEMVEASSQFFHLDPEDVIMTKIFVYVEDVDRETGPTTALPANRSTIVRRAIDYRNERVPDEVIAEQGGAENLVEAVGPASTMAFLDTCRCFHMGSRKAEKPRYVIMIQYQTPYAAPAPAEGPLPTTPLSTLAVPPNPTPLEEYLYGLKR
jgi:hypothetical protein